MGEQVRHAAGAAIFDVVMDGMGVAARGLEGGEHRRRHGAARNHKALAEGKILEPALLRHHAMACRIELGHGWWFPRDISLSSVSQQCDGGNWHQLVIPGLRRSAHRGMTLEEISAS